MEFENSGGNWMNSGINSSFWLFSTLVWHEFILSSELRHWPKFHDVLVCQCHWPKRKLFVQGASDTLGQLKQHASWQCKGAWCIRIWGKKDCTLCQLYNMPDI